MPEERLPLDQAIRLLRAKAGELEADAMERINMDSNPSIGYLAADIALIATILADHMERAPFIGHRAHRARR